MRKYSGFASRRHSLPAETRRARADSSPRSGNRSVANMFIDLGEGVALTDEQFQAEMVKRRQASTEDVIIGCPLCNNAKVKEPATGGN